MNEPQRRIMSRIALAAAACIAAGTIWYVLFTAHIVVPDLVEPDNAALFAWWRPIEWQTMGIHLLVATAFLGTAVVGLVLGPGTASQDAPSAGAGAALLALGGALSATAHLIQMGGQHAVLVASTTQIDDGVLGAVGFTIDSVTRAIEVAGYAGLGLGCIAVTFGLVPMETDGVGRLLGGLLGAGLIALAVLSVSDPADLIDALTGVVGIVLAPAWLWRLATDLRAPSRTAMPRSVRAEGTGG